MKRLGFLLLTLVLAAGISACSKSSPYAADITMMKDTCKLLNEFTTAVEGAKDAHGLGLTIMDFIPKYKAVKPELEKLGDKYPNFGRTGGEENAPKELKPILKQVRISYELLRMAVESKATRWRRDERATIMMDELKDIMYHY